MTYSAGLFRTVILLFMIAAPFESVVAEAKGTVLVTGANRGIGLALAERFSRAGYQVIGTARSPDKATALKELDVRIEQLDVTDQASVDALAASLDGVSIDFLVNNAGIKGKDSSDLANLDISDIEWTLNVNTLGPLRVTSALYDNLLRSDRKVVANISSMMGSMEMNTWGCCVGYRLSKSAVNSLTKTLAVDYAEQGMVFVTLHPGYVQTDMNDGQGRITPARSADGLFEVISGLEAEDNGRYYNFDGKELPW